MEIKKTNSKTRSDITPETEELQAVRRLRLAEALRKNLRRRKKADIEATKTPPPGSTKNYSNST